MKFSRRNLLRGAAGISVALPWLESYAQAAATPPRRVVFVFTANGDQISRRFTTKSESGFVFDDMLSPYQPYRSNLLVMEGINKYHGRLPDGARADGHEQGGSALAPWKSGSGSFPIGGTSDSIGYVLGPSADKAIGDKLVADNPSLKFPHLNYRVGQNYNNIWNQHSHAGPVGTQSPIAPEVNPLTAYTRIFAGVDTTGSTVLTRRLAMRQSALDLVKNDLASLQSKVSTVDKARLEQHAESIRELERGLQGMAQNAPACKPLTMPTWAANYHLNDDNYAEVGLLFFKITAMALACDLTRAVNFNWSGNTSDRVYKEFGHTDGHHTMSHNSDDVSFDKIRQIKKGLFSRTTKLFDELKSLNEGSGTLWDHTLVVNWSELSQGNTHQTDQDLVVFAGGAHGYFRTGRYLNFSTQNLRSFSNMLISVWQYMGYTNTTTWGEPLLLPNGGGPLAGLTT